MLQLAAECVLDAKAMLGEGPVWDDKLQELVWVDIENLTLHRFRPGDGQQTAYTLEKKVGAAVPAEDGTWMLALQDGIYRFNMESRKTSIAALTNEEAAWKSRLNDGKCDPQGRFWAGSMSGVGQKHCSLYSLGDGDQLIQRLSGVETSNGLAWSLDGHTMYYIDSGEKIVSAFDYDAGSGEITNRRTIITFPEGEGGPDGMSIDAEGMLWIGHWGGWQPSRWNPQTGEKLTRVNVPAAHVTSCAFGGPNLDELYITTSRIGADEQALKDYPLTGGVFKVKPGVKGLPVHRYKY